MVHDPAWESRTAASRPRTTGLSAIAHMLFVAALGAAFWIGTVWASQSWLALGR